MADDSFDEPFDSIPPKQAVASTPNAPPSFAFDHGNNMMSTSLAGPPAAAFRSPTMAPPGGGEDDGGYGKEEEEEPSLMSSQLNDRWKQYETEKVALPSAAAPPTTMPPPSFAPTPDADLAPRQPYSFNKSPSYDTNELIRKYGGMAGVAVHPPVVRQSEPSPEKVRDRAQKMLELADDYAVRRTESGGLPSTTPSSPPSEPYSFRKSASAKRVPAALAGLQMTSSVQPRNERYSFSDPSFRDDDHISDEEDTIFKDVDAPFQDEPVVDVAGIENRNAGARPYSDDPSQFEGDFEGGSSAWSSRYSDNPYISRNRVLDSWDKEFKQEDHRKSARNMFMSTASNVRSSASNALQAAGSKKEKIFGSGGFSFRANHVFGNHRSAAAERDEVNLRTAWREVEAPVKTNAPVHKTWQEVMLNKRKRRRILCVLLLIVLGTIAAISSVTAIQNRQARASLFAGANIGQTVTFYVTSDSPYDRAAEERLSKDLINIPVDSEFVFHLGNIQDASASLCPRNRYSDVASILLKSPVPVFIVPGADDWTMCPDPGSRLTQWKKEFEDFDLKFKHALPVKRDIDNPEAFAFLHKGVLFMGLHIVSGPVPNDDEWQEIQRQMLKFYFGMANANKGSFRSIVLLGNARPSAQQTLFFDAMFSNLKDHHAPLIYIHANQKSNEVIRYNPFKDHQDIQVIGVQDGNTNPPLRISIGFGDYPVSIG